MSGPGRAPELTLGSDAALAVAGSASTSDNATVSRTFTDTPRKTVAPPVDFRAMPQERCSPRALVSLGVTLARTKGTPLATRTVDVAVGGLRVSADPPLTHAARVSFDLVLDGGSRVAGRARVLREERHRVYALCFEALGQDATASLARLGGAAGASLSRLVDAAGPAATTGP